MQRYLEDNKRQIDHIFARAAELHEDPLHCFLIGVKLFAELMDKVHDLHPGCITAAVTYQDQLFDAEVRNLSAEGMLASCQRFPPRSCTTGITSVCCSNRAKPGCGRDRARSPACRDPW